MERFVEIMANKVDDIVKGSFSSPTEDRHLRWQILTSTKC